MENAERSSAIGEQVAAMTKPKNAAAAINDILNSVQALMPLAHKPRNDRAARLYQAESEVFRASIRSEHPTSRSARLAGAERDVTNDARQARANRVVREFRNRYDLWRA
jgi:hypothetical protein